MADITITHEQDGNKGEYIAHVEGSDEVGRLTWKERAGVRVAEHTLVPEPISRQGVAEALVKALVADAREQGFLIKPLCSYVEWQFDQHLEWADLRV